MATRKVVSDVLISGDVNYASAFPGAPAGGTGSVVVVNAADMSRITGAVTYGTVPAIYIGVYEAGYGWHLSPLIDGAYVTGYRAEGFRAEAAQIITAGYSAISGVGSIALTNEAEYTMHITDFSNKEIRFNRKTYVYFSSAAATQLEIATAFAALINADEGAPWTATTVNDGGGNYGIVVTGLTRTGGFDRTVYFEVNLDGAFETTTPVYEDQAVDFGVGNWFQVLDQEKIAAGYRGHMNMVWMPRDHAYRAGTTDQDILVITFGQNSEQQYTNAILANPYTLTICFPDGTAPTSRSTTQTILNAWMASVPGAFPNVTI